MAYLLYKRWRYSLVDERRKKEDHRGAFKWYATRRVIIIPGPPPAFSLERTYQALGRAIPDQFMSWVYRCSRKWRILVPPRLENSFSPSVGDVYRIRHLYAYTTIKSNPPRRIPQFPSQETDTDQIKHDEPRITKPRSKTICLFPLKKKVYMTPALRRVEDMYIGAREKKK